MKPRTLPQTGGGKGLRSRFLAGGLDALEDHRPRPNPVWNRIPEEAQGSGERAERLNLTRAAGLHAPHCGSPAISVTTWSIGPSLLAPLLDGGRRAANVDAARAQYAAAEAAASSRVRGAVREVEAALVRLASATGRAADTATAANGYRSNLTALDKKYHAGLASLVELEDARRLAIAGDAALTALEQERVAAWIALYRAVGGGWDREAALATR